MARFDINKVTFELNGDSYTIGPLDGLHLGMLYEVLDAMELASIEKGDTKADDIFKTFSKPNVDRIHMLLLETFSRAYPKEDKETLGSFISQNIMELFNHLIKANLSKMGASDDKPE